METGLVIAAALAALTGIAHSVLGERYILIRLFRRQDLPKLFGNDRFTRRTLRFAWHVTSVAWWGFAALLLLVAAQRPAGAPGVLSVIAGTFLATAVIVAIGSRGRHLSWIVFLSIAILAWLGR